ncbi:hypothetical protein Q9233_017267 [Columba guinea]|nr:hypothetical protein Q9233_017267 [Columba guinea]
MPTRPGPAAALYGASAALDAVDGAVARRLNQGTRFGAMLDMLTDRLSSMCLLVNLALLYPATAALFQLSMALDVASHWLHMHCTTLEGGASHKDVGGGGAPAAAPLLHKQAAAVRALRRERSVLLRPLPGELQRRAPRAPGGPGAVPAPPLGRDPHGRPQVPAEPAAAGRSRRAIGRPGRRRQAIGRGAQTQNPVNPPQNQPGTPAKCPQNTPINGATAEPRGVSSPLTR